MKRRGLTWVEADAQPEGARRGSPGRDSPFERESLHFCDDAGEDGGDPLQPNLAAGVKAHSMCSGPVGRGVDFSSRASGTIARNTSASTQKVSVTAIIAACRWTMPYTTPCA